MYRLMFLCVCALIIFAFQVDAAFLPRYLTPCKVYDPQISKCWAQGIESLRPHLATGIKELQIPPVEPLYISKLSVSRKQSDTATYETTLKNVVVNGLKSFQILSSYIDPKSLLIKLKIGFPRLRWTVRNGIGQGNVLGFPVNGTYKSDLDFTNLALDFVLDGEEYDVYGRKYIDWSEGSIEVTYDSIRFTIGGLFQDQYLSQAFNDALNQNAFLLDGHIKPIIEKSVGAFVIDVINRVHKTYSSDDLYPKY